jgi:hypothetical protein
MQEERLFARRPASCSGALHASTAAGVEQSESSSPGSQKHIFTCAGLEWPHTPMLTLLCAGIDKRSDRGGQNSTHSLPPTANSRRTHEERRMDARGSMMRTLCVCRRLWPLFVSALPLCRSPHAPAGSAALLERTSEPPRRRAF